MEPVSKLSSSPRICKDLFRNEGFCIYAIVFWGSVFPEDGIIIFLQKVLTPTVLHRVV